jgi:arabinogalactan endo-1,4-beta-galactosidase
VAGVCDGARCLLALWGGTLDAMTLARWMGPLALSLCLQACSPRSVVVADWLDASPTASAMNVSSADGETDAVVDAGARRSDYLLGADISWVQEEEAAGTTYFDAGQEQDILDILKHHGFNAIRLRLFNAPNSPCRLSATGSQTCGYQTEGERDEPFCDLDHTLAMAQRVKAAGMQLMLNFHFSDTWADPGDQNKPLAWESLGFDELVAALGSYTRASLERFAAAGVMPDIVQLGNGITAGMLYPDGVSTDENWPRFAELLKSAIAAVKAVDPETQVLLHLDKPDSFDTSSWWVQSALAHGVEFDILGQTCFPQTQGPSSGWRTTFANLAATYPTLRYMIVEYSQERRTVNDIMLQLPAERGVGSFVWEPTAWRETLFDTSGNEKSSNERMLDFDQLLSDYGLPKP